MSDRYSDDDFESSAATSEHTATSKTTSRSASAAAAHEKASASASRSQSVSALVSREGPAASGSAHSDAASSEASSHKSSAASYTESEPSSKTTSASSSASPSHHSSRHSSPSASAHSSHPSSASQHQTRAVAAVPTAAADEVAAPQNGASAKPGSRKGRAAPQQGSPRSARAADRFEESPVPETQEQLDDMLVDNEELRERLYELQRSRYRAGLSSTRRSSQNKKDEAAAAVQETLANERLAQILRSERKDLRQQRDYLQELVKRYKKASKYRDLIVQAKDDIDMLNEENRDLQLEVRCNEKLLVANAEAADSGVASHRLQEELRARNALTERGVQHALRDADDAERQRDGLQQRVDALKSELEARRSAPSSRHLDDLEEAREDNREKRSRVRALEHQLARSRGGNGGNAGKAAPRTSLSLRTEAEREYLRERISAMRAELRQIENGTDEDDGADDYLSGVQSPNNNAGSAAAATGAAPATRGGPAYPSALQSHEQQLSASAQASRKSSVAAAASPHGQSAAWLEEADVGAGQRGSASAAGGSTRVPPSGVTSPSHKGYSGTSAPVVSAANTTEEDPFFAAAFGDEAQPAAPAPPAETYDFSAPPAAEPENDWLLDAMRDPGTEVAPPRKESAAHDEAPDWLMGDGASAQAGAQAPVEDFVFQEEPVDDVFGDMQFNQAAAPPAPAAVSTGGGDDVPDWLQF